MTQNDPDVPTPEDAECFDYPIYQFDKGTLYEKTITGSRDRAVWRCDKFEDYLDPKVVARIRMLYPGISASDIFMSDED